MARRMVTRIGCYKLSQKEKRDDFKQVYTAISKPTYGDVLTFLGTILFGVKTALRCHECYTRRSEIADCDGHALIGCSLVALVGYIFLAPLPMASIYSYPEYYLDFSVADPGNFPPNTKLLEEYVINHTPDYRHPEKGIPGIFNGRNILQESENWRPIPFALW
jgi:hypothetical protein